MKAIELQKILEVVAGVTSDTLDHLAKRFADEADKLGDEYAHLAGFAAAWQKLPKRARALFVEQLLKSYALVVAGTLATKAGLTAAGKKQKQLRAAVLTMAELVEPMAKKAGKKAKKKLKKRAREAKKRIKKAVD